MVGTSRNVAVMGGMRAEPPNPRLQRTRSASPPSPLSRQPLGGRGE
jgi:hypothetical protein